LKFHFLWNKKKGKQSVYKPGSVVPEGTVCHLSTT